LEIHRLYLDLFVTFFSLLCMKLKPLELKICSFVVQPSTTHQ